MDCYENLPALAICSPLRRPGLARTSSDLRVAGRKAPREDVTRANLYHPCRDLGAYVEILETYLLLSKWSQA